jgi:mono/diheme cytochrome c family protein
MNQVKYLISASLILLCLLLGLLFYSLLPSENRVEQSQTESEKNTAEAPPSPGKAIFQQNCQSCHALDKKLSGPSLRGVTERGPWTNRKNIYRWIQNPAAFIPTTPYTVALHKEYGQIMPSFPQLSEKDIDAILEYITQVSAYNTGPVAMQ